MILFHRSHRLYSLFFILFNLFSSEWTLLKILWSNSDSSDWSILMLMLSIIFFISFIVFFHSRILILLFFMISFSWLNFSFRLRIVFLTWFNDLSMFSCSSLRFLKTNILTSLLGKSQISMSWHRLPDYYDPLVVSYIPYFSCSLKSWVAVLTFEVSPLPVFTLWLQEEITFHQPC